MKTVNEIPNNYEELIKEIENSNFEFKHDLIAILKNEKIREKYVETKAVSIIFSVLKDFKVTDDYITQNKGDYIIKNLHTKLCNLDTQIDTSEDSIDEEVLKSIYDNEILDLNKLNLVGRISFLNKEIIDVLNQAQVKTKKETYEEIKNFLEKKFRENAKEINDFLIKDLDKDIKKACNFYRGEIEKATNN